ncbi:hypothetical protein BLNAU_22740 [Blattamonas nauphoetae]|uniref:Uncharacterized protein n=1 Tax=Blattamonas nauphoetae TaxID=2049346 RepID=A0ABQ9WS83_9EUKA|nr:hypothetical protein BLNAU_22740 [Blattamonas nauphoetae]
MTLSSAGTEDNSHRVSSVDSERLINLSPSLYSPTHPISSLKTPLSLVRKLVKSGVCLSSSSSLLAFTGEVRFGVLDAATPVPKLGESLGWDVKEPRSVVDACRNTPTFSASIVSDVQSRRSPSFHTLSRLSAFQCDARMICSFDASSVNGIARITNVEFGPTRDIVLISSSIRTTLFRLISVHHCVFMKLIILLSQRNDSSTTQVKYRRRSDFGYTQI